MIKPVCLHRGDRVAAISLSWGGAGAFPHRYEVGKRQLEERFGLEVVETRHALRDPDWLAKNPRARADDLMEAFADPSIRGIISIIGGDDSIRLLPFIDDELIRSNPKIFLGYSDTTVSHWACFRAGLVTFYGPSIMTGLAENGGIHPYMADAVERALFRPEPIGLLQSSREGWTDEFLDWANPENRARRRSMNPPLPWRFLQGSGVATGHLLGGCVEVVEFLRGTSVWPDASLWDRAILFLETSEEGAPPRTLTRALRSYAAMGILGRLSGLLIGRPGGRVPVEKFAEYDQAVLQVVREEEGLSELPIVTCMDFGHTDPTLVLPLGVQARIDSEALAWRSSRRQPRSARACASNCRLAEDAELFMISSESWGAGVDAPHL
jgi:muramoyltetrapeptide carboxypeptidase LdcA involved in peptidoglycan recycling